MSRSNVLLISLALAAVIGCGQVKVVSSVTQEAPPASDAAKQLLDSSMDMYHSLHSFSAAIEWTGAIGPEPENAKRTLEYVAPNLYKSVTNTTGTMGPMTMTSVSDGNKVLEYTTLKGVPGQSYPAPASLAETTSMLMQHPMFGGTLLYRFFGGSDQYDKLVDDARGKAALGAEAKEPGEMARHVKFYSSGFFGHADVLIGEKSFKVYEISYDMEPILEQMKQAKSSKGKASITASVKEQYSDIKMNPSLVVSDFSVTAPKGIEVTQAGEEGQAKPPFPVGSAAPDFKVTPLKGGTPVSLASLRGKPVLVDFWATWCGPCKESLPHTQALYNDFKSKGLQVLVVSDEEAPTIQSFIDQNKYTFPVFRDEGHSAETAYKVDAIPTVLIIDKEGKLQSYMVGLQDESTLRDALKKLGIQ